MRGGSERERVGQGHLSSLQRRVGGEKKGTDEQLV